MSKQKGKYHKRYTLRVTEKEAAQLEDGIGERLPEVLGLVKQRENRTGHVRRGHQLAAHPLG